MERSKSSFEMLPLEILNIIANDLIPLNDRLHTEVSDLLKDFINFRLISKATANVQLDIHRRDPLQYWERRIRNGNASDIRIVKDNLLTPTSSRTTAEVLDYLIDAAVIGPLTFEVRTSVYTMKTEMSEAILASLTPRPDFRDALLQAIYSQDFDLYRCGQFQFLEILLDTRPDLKPLLARIGDGYLVEAAVQMKDTRLLRMLIRHDILVVELLGFALFLVPSPTLVEAILSAIVPQTRADRETLSCLMLRALTVATTAPYWEVFEDEILEAQGPFGPIFDSIEKVVAKFLKSVCTDASSATFLIEKVKETGMLDRSPTVVKMRASLIIALHNVRLTVHYTEEKTMFPSDNEHFRAEVRSWAIILLEGDLMEEAAVLLGFNNACGESA